MQKRKDTPDPSTVQRLTRFLQFNPTFVAAILLVSVLALGWKADRPKFHLPLDRVFEVTGWVSRTPEIRDQSVYFELSPETICQQSRSYPYSERIAVWVTSSVEKPEDFFDPPLQYGEILRFTTFLKEPSYYAIPGVQDHRWLAWLSGTPFRAQLKSPEQLERLGQTWIGILTSPFFQYLHRFESHSRTVLKEQTFRFLLGVFLGRKRSLEETEIDLIRNLGLLHLFVVSGFHISLIIFVLHFLLSGLRRVGCVAAVTGIWLYILAIGFPLAAVRAGIIASVAYALISFGLKRNLLNGLGISAIAIVCASPRSLFSASFHLSYVCLCAIGLLVLPLMKYVRAVKNGIEDFKTTRILLERNDELILRRRIRFLLESNFRFESSGVIRFFKKPGARAASYILTLLLCSLCIQLLLFPVALHYTNRWSLTQGLNNLLFIPLFSLLIGLCFFFFLTFWSPLGAAFRWSLEQCSDLCHTLIFGLAPLSPVSFLPHPRWWESLLYIVLVLFLTRALPGRIRLWVLVLPVSLLLALKNPSPGKNDLVITMLDVGQSESIHLRYPNGENALIDTGGFSYPPKGNFVGERLLSRYLWHLRIRDLLYVLISHPDSDHKKGYAFVKKVFPIRNLFYSEAHSDYEEPKKRLLADDSFFIAGVRHLIHHPSENDLDFLEGNEASMVLTLQYRNFSMLFTGDISAQVERRLLPRFRRVTALKVAHHGSASSSCKAFLKLVRPRVAMASAGRDHTFGHPSQAVLDRLRMFGTRVFSTRSFGSIRLITDGSNLSIEHYSMEAQCFQPLYGPLSIERVAGGMSFPPLAPVPGARR